MSVSFGVFYAAFTCYHLQPPTSVVGIMSLLHSSRPTLLSKRTGII